MSAPQTPPAGDAEALRETVSRWLARDRGRDPDEKVAHLPGKPVMWTLDAPNADFLIETIRAAGFVVARPVADDGLREAIGRLICLMEEGLDAVSAMSDSNKAHWLHWRAEIPTYLATADAILPLIHAREAALRAERDEARKQNALWHRRAQKAEGALERRDRKHWMKWILRLRERARKAEADLATTRTKLAEARAQAFDEAAQVARAYPDSEIAQRHSNAAVCWNTASNIADTIRARAALPSDGEPG